MRVQYLSYRLPLVTAGTKIFEMFEWDCRANEPSTNPSKAEHSRPRKP